MKYQCLLFSAIGLFTPLTQARVLFLIRTSASRIVLDSIHFRLFLVCFTRHYTFEVKIYHLSQFPTCAFFRKSEWPPLNFLNSWAREHRNEAGEYRILLKESDIPEAGLGGRSSADLKLIYCFDSDIRRDRDDLFSNNYIKFNAGSNPAMGE